MLSHSDTYQSVTYRQTDGQNSYINIARQHYCANARLCCRRVAYRAILRVLTVVSFNSTKRRVESLPRDAMHKRGLCRHVVSVCVSVCVCLSVTFVSCVKTNKHVIKIFSPSGSHAILVFPCQTA